jgi:hypothetical protein
VTIILILLGASASAGLAIGLALFRVEAIILASLFLALLCAALLPYHGFGPGGDVSISVGLLAALQSSFFRGYSHELAGDGRLTESSAELVNRYGL